LGARRGRVSFNLPQNHRHNVELAKLLCERISSVDKVQFTDSATKATNFAVRLARAYTGREKFAKFIGGYHGAWDGTLYGTASRYGADPLKKEPLPGVPRSAADDVVFLPYNEPEECQRIIEENANELGSVIVEPLIGDGYIPPLPGFLQLLQDLCQKHGIVFICDETITFTLAPGGAQELFGLDPDLTTMGKSIGGGMPTGATAGKDAVMARNDPLISGLIPVPAGTSLGGHCLAAVAGVAQLRLMTPRVYARLDQLGERFRAGVKDAAERLGIPELQATGVRHLNNLHWAPAPITTYRDHMACDSEKLNLIEEAVFAAGYMIGWGCRINLSAAMTDEDIDGFVNTVAHAASEIAK
jgi:glutamate-1-semialdehyde 2,1-aminomutase